MSVKINRNFVKAMLGVRGLSLRDLAVLSELGEATMYRIINGAEFNSKTLGKLATALDVSPVDLLDVSGYADPHLVAPPA